EVTDACEAEPVAPLADEAHQVGTVAKPVRGRREAGVLRPVAADGDQVLDPARHHQLAVPRDLVATRLDGRDVHRALDAEPLDAIDDLDGRLTWLSARAGDGEERGLQRADRKG